MSVLQASHPPRLFIFSEIYNSYVNSNCTCNVVIVLFAVHLASTGDIDYKTLGNILAGTLMGEVSTACSGTCNNFYGVL